MIFIAVMLFGSLSFMNIKSESDNKSDFVVITGSIAETSQIFTKLAEHPENIKSVKSSETVTIKTVASSKTLTEITTITTVSDISDTATASASESVEFPININTASIDELMALNGIGEVTASAIIEYRNQNGNFKNRDELLNIKGIGEKKLSDIYDFIFVENEYWDYPETDVYEEPVEEYNDYNEEYQETQPPVEVTDVPETSVENITVNLNTASKDELMTLPYVDNKVADDIIALRNNIQCFSHPYELLMIESLTQEQVAEIINFVSV